ncbi:NlpC/P60 family protein [Arsenicicoccus sp. UBA6765]|uniref:NlpC/P60 family protein n=1 Tax=Arsenicicoccus sp. UBA6765 TaxID=1946056 RepID=UPI0002D56E51
MFFGKDAASIHHVGMYIGNGKMVNAPHTGAQVRVESMYWSDLLPYGGRVR